MVISTMSENEGNKTDTRGRDGPGPEVGDKRDLSKKTTPVACHMSSKLPHHEEILWVRHGKYNVPATGDLK